MNGKVRGGALERGLGGRYRGRGPAHPLQYDYVAVCEFLPVHWVHHVLPNQLLHALKGDHGPTVVRGRVGPPLRGPAPEGEPHPQPAPRSPMYPCVYPLTGDSRGPQYRARRGIAQAVAGHGAHVALTACDEPHTIHGAIQRCEAHRRQVRHAQRLPRHGAGHGARLGERERGRARRAAEGVGASV